MKFKDIYTSLKKDIDLQKTHPKINIEVEVFDYSQNKIDLSEELEKTISLGGNKNFHIKRLSKKTKPFDSVYQGKKPLIHISDLNKKKLKLEYIKFKFSHYYNNIKLIKNHIKISKYLIIFGIFILLCFINKSIIEYNTNSGYKKLLSLQDSQRTKSIESIIDGAHFNFSLAKVLLFPFKIIPNTKINNAYHIIDGGKEVTTLLKKNITIGREVQNLISEKKPENIMFSQLILNNKNVFLNLYTDIENIQSIYNRIHFSETQLDLKEKLDILKEKLKEIKYYSYTFNNNFETFLETLGHSERKKYLIAFQNNDEIRANGGFMGSLGIVEIFRGQIKNFEKNDVYFYEFKIKKEQFTKEIAPEGINKLTPSLGLRDSNYYINHKDSGDKIEFFMKKAGYPIDGIIYINMTTLGKILDIVGEFESTTLGRQVNSQNFSTIMSILVESKVSQKGTTGTPKQILFDFMKEFQKVIKEKNISEIELIKIIKEDILNREITIYSTNNKERQLLKSLSLYNPIIYSSSLDFSYPVFTSISGNKSDRYIKHSYNKIISQGPECSFNTSLELKSEHTLTQENIGYISNLISELNINENLKENLLKIQGNGENKHYVRIIIPKEAIVTNKNVDKIEYSDRGQSVNFYMNTGVGKSSSFILNYYLPNKECKTYSYKLYKQPGITPYDIQIDNFGKKTQYVNNKKDIYIN